MRKITELILHCTATNAGREVSVKELDAWHRARGFNGCGYHFVVHLDGSVQCARPVELKGAHCKGHNAQSIGIAYVGGLRYGQPADTRTPQQRQSLIALCRALRYFVPGLKIYGHYEFANKACPCFDMDTFRKEVSLTPNPSPKGEGEPLPQPLSQGEGEPLPQPLSQGEGSI